LWLLVLLGGSGASCVAKYMPQVQKRSRCVANLQQISLDESVADLARRLQGITIDVLINNAGMMQRNTLARLDFDSIRRQFEVNAIGALRVTEALLPQLQAGSKIALITSRMGSIAEGTLRER
jgi:short-subunit dehydrogenase